MNTHYTPAHRRRQVILTMYSLTTNPKMNFNFKYQSQPSKEIRKVLIFQKHPHFSNVLFFTLQNVNKDVPTVQKSPHFPNWSHFPRWLWSSKLKFFPTKTERESTITQQHMHMGIRRDTFIGIVQTHGQSQTHAHTHIWKNTHTLPYSPLVLGLYFIPCAASESH